MIEVTNIGFGYDENEDRLVVTCADGKQAQPLLVTRRIARRLLQGFANILEVSSPAVSRAPAGLRHEVIALEHFSSLAAVPEGQPGPADPGISPVSLPPTLAIKVDVEVHPTLFRLVIGSVSEPLVTLSLTRGDFHKLLAAFDHWANVAEWNIQGDAGWLNGAQAAVASIGGANAS